MQERRTIIKKRIFQICVGGCLFLFFLFAALMTFQSHKNYLASCIPVETLKNSSAGFITVTKSHYVSCSLQPDGTFTFSWGEIYDSLEKGDHILVDVGNRILPAELINRFQIEGRRFMTARIDAPIGDVLMEQPSGLTITATFQSPYRPYVIPASCVISADKGYLVPVAMETQKVWGMAYEVRYETLAVHEINDEKCSVRGLPTGGKIIVKSDGRLWDGANILITGEQEY